MNNQQTNGSIAVLGDAALRSSALGSASCEKAAKPGDKTPRNPAHRLVLVENSSRSRRGNRARSHRRAAAERGLVHFPHQQLARGPKPTADPSAEQIQQLLRRNKRLTEQLRKAEIIIDVQNKVARLLGLTLAEPDPKDLS